MVWQKRRVLAANAGVEGEIFGITVSLTNKWGLPVNSKRAI
jgi:hypothetical protein